MTRAKLPPWLVAVAAALLLVAGVAVAVSIGEKGPTPISAGGADATTSSTRDRGSSASTGTTEPGASATTVAPTTGAAPDSTLPGAPAVRFTACGSFQCAKVPVPLDYADPGGRQIQISVIVRRASDPSRRLGALLTNPGGPGASGFDFVQSSSALFGTLRDRYDIVGFDPRGVGASSPVTCLTGKDLDAFISLDPSPDDAAEKQALIDGSKRYDAACQANSGDILPFVGTVNAARDMDAIRIALGEEKINYLGFSYGTDLGATYATLFPNRVGHFALDGPVDPTLPAIEVGAAQAIGFEEDLQHFLEDCAGRSSCSFFNGGNPGPALDAILAKVETTPLPASGGRTVGPAEAFLGVLTGLYQKAAWPALASALHAAQGGDGRALLRLADSYTDRRADGSYSNTIDANNAVNCVDKPWPTDVASYDALAARLAKQAPHFGAPVAYTFTCAFWSVPPTAEQPVINAHGAPPILVIGATADPATPYAWAQAMTRQLEGARLLTRNGDGHTSYIVSSCIKTKVDAFLTDGTLPADGTSC